MINPRRDTGAEKSMETSASLKASAALSVPTIHMYATYASRKIGRIAPNAGAADGPTSPPSRMEPLKNTIQK